MRKEHMVNVHAIFSDDLVKCPSSLLALWRSRGL